MSGLSQEFWDKAAFAAKAIQRDPALAEVVGKEVDAFFARNDGLQRDQLTEAFIAGLVIDQLSSGAETPAQPQTQNAESKVA